MKSSSKKIVRLSNLSKNNRLLKNEKNLVFCYGSFNIIHPGHLRYFQNARKYGKKLYVAIEGDAFINKKDLAQQFNELERAEAVSALEFIDKVIILDNAELFDLVKIITPKTLILGKEFERERYQQIQTAVEALHEFGGKIIFHAGCAGSGQAAKLCNNLMLGIEMVAVSDGFVLADKLVNLIVFLIFYIILISTFVIFSIYNNSFMLFLEI